MNENQIVVYQPNETVRLDVRLENETVWLTQSQMATLFGSSADNIGLHLKKVYSVGELSREATTEDFSVVRTEGTRQVQRKYGCRNHPRSSRLNPQGEKGVCEMKDLERNFFHRRALCYGGQVAFTKLDYAEILCIEK